MKCMGFNIEKYWLWSHNDFFVAHEAKIARAFCIVHKELFLFGRMGIVAASAGKFPAGPQRIRFTFHWMGIGGAEGRHHVSSR